MTSPIDQSNTPPRRIGRSIGAFFAGFVTIVVLSLGTDQLFHALDVYPPWGEPMRDPGLNALALTYRIAYGVLGGYITARLAPRNPMAHALALGVVGFVFASVGAVVAISKQDLGPAWYPVALALTTLPTAWLGGFLHLRTRRVERPAV